MKSITKKFFSVVTVVAMLVLLSLGNTAQAGAETKLDVLGTYQGEHEYITTCRKAFYFDKGSALEIRFRYDAVDGSVAMRKRSFNHTLEFRVFDTSYNGWQITYLGPNGYDKTQECNLPQEGDTCVMTVPFSVVEAKYTGHNAIGGFNIQTGEIGASKVTVLSVKIVGDAMFEGGEFEASGSWQKETEGTMQLKQACAGKAVISPNKWHIDVSQFSVSGFTNPTVDVTVNYPELPGYVQAEIKVGGKPVNENYPSPRRTGTMTYTTELPPGTTSFLACYDKCTVTGIRVYDNTETEPSKVTGKGAEEINQNMNPCWNLGNALDCFDTKTGEVGENFWGNPIATQKLFQRIKAEGFRAVRIPVSYLNRVDSKGNIEEDYLARVKKIVSVAKNSGLYVIINMQHDGGYGVPGQWLDISKTGEDFTEIRKKYTKMWQQIAFAFQDVDQHLVFESMNEVKVSGSGSAAIQSAYKNINALNQAFVDAVRSADGYNIERCLIIPGYNQDIDLTAQNYGTGRGFQVPVDSKPNKLILSVHFFDPYDFTKNLDSSTTSCTMAELRAIRTQFAKIKEVTELPVFVGAYGAVDKGNVYDRADYLSRVRTEAARQDMTLAYWDNGNYGNLGEEAFALFDRQINEATEEGKILLSAIMGTYE